jgi:Arc/MetJ-type ribon-helix-helix transcriptional regulator
MLEQLPTHLRDFVEREVTASHYETETAVIEEALARLADEAGRVTVEEAVAEALAQVERGEAIEYTDDFLKRSAARGRTAAADTGCAMRSGIRVLRR